MDDDKQKRLEELEKRLSQCEAAFDKAKGQIPKQKKLIHRPLLLTLAVIGIILFISVYRGTEKQETKLQSLPTEKPSKSDCLLAKEYTEKFKKIMSATRGRYQEEKIADLRIEYELKIDNVSLETDLLLWGMAYQGYIGKGMAYYQKDYQIRKQRLEELCE